MDHASLAMTIQAKPQHVRNICVCAHIDHGKTTLVDTLLASNDLIAKEHSGQLRYMDYLYTEQERCITMKASAVSLLHLSDNQMIIDLFKEQNTDPTKAVRVPLLMNVIDTPGHCDFSHEVLAAVSICDGAFLLVDAIEGVASQTLGVLKHLIKLQIDIVLVINKLDRLYNELNIGPLEAYFHLLKLIDESNAAYSSVWMEVEGKPTAHQEYFSPIKDNVVFASAIGNWGFTISSFAKILVEKYPFIASIDHDRTLLYKNLWDAAIAVDLTNGCFRAVKKSLAPAFVTLILESVWAVLTCDQLDTEAAFKKLSKMYRKCMGKPFEQATTNNSSISHLIKSFLSDWLSLSSVIFNSAVISIHSPLLSKNIISRGVRAALDTQALDLFNKVAPTVILCGKVLNEKDLDLPQRARLRTDNQRSFLLCKVLAGSVAINQSFTILAYTEKENTCKLGITTVVKDFYCPMIQSIVPYTTASPHEGNICILEVSATVPFGSLLIDSNTAFHIGREIDAILLSYRSQHMLVEATCSDTSDLALSATSGKRSEKGLEENQLKALKRIAKRLDGLRYIEAPSPLIHVSITPISLKGYPQLISALNLLCTVDSSAIYSISSVNGEIILAVSGDVHLDRCCEQLDSFLIDIYGKDCDEGYYVIGDSILHLKEHVMPGRCASATLFSEPPEILQVALTDHVLSLQNAHATENGAAVALETPLEDAFFDDCFGVDTEEVVTTVHISSKQSSDLYEHSQSSVTKYTPDYDSMCAAVANTDTTLKEIFDKIDAHSSSLSREQSCDTDTLQYAVQMCNRFVQISNFDVLKYYHQLCGKNLVTASVLSSFISGLSLSKCGHPMGTEILQIKMFKDKVILTRHTIAFICTANSYVKAALSSRSPEEHNIAPIYIDTSSNSDIDDYECTLFYHSLSEDPHTGLSVALIEAFKILINAGPLCEEPVTNLALIALHNVVEVKSMLKTDFLEQHRSCVAESWFLSSFLDKFYIRSTLSYVSVIPAFLGVMQSALVYSNIGIAEPFIKAIIKAPPQFNIQNLLACFERMRCIKDYVDFKPNGSSEFTLYIPSSNSLLFQIELRKESSGRLNLELQPYKYLVLKEDPRHSDIALDDEELIEWGQQGRYREFSTNDEDKNKRKDALSSVCGKYLSRRLQISTGLHYSGSNNAKRLVEIMKKNKGLLVLQGIVIEAEKQRTIRRNR
ncbi:Elongation factor 2 [Giardia lamblia P15]|uniref:Elongation factor 2 n=1 Tax=Giardia intestinalis (strain P15) TaxID=658858 RepID=E1F144_GIAIA|nr:Elongation factor 2 [Giardia lamblia P15]